jgi:predicted nucleic acid-binding Zn ribbon protein
MSEQPLTVYARAYPATDRLTSNRNQNKRDIDQIIVFDTETTIDPSQRLTFGCFRYYKRNPFGRWVCYAEGLIYADDLPQRDPDGFAVLRQYARDHAADTDITSRGASRDLPVISRDEFTNRWLYDKGYRAKKWQGIEPATIVGFNLPFDLSRLAIDAGKARKKYAGGFSFTLFARKGGQPNWHRPRIAVKALGAHKALIGFTGSKTRDGYDPDDDARNSGHFLDLHTLVFALTNKSHSLRSAGEAFKCEHLKSTAESYGQITSEFIDYCRRDVLATYDLYEKVMAEYSRHPVGRPATAMYSPASVAKSYLDAMGVAPPVDSVSAKVLGYAMASFYGGRAEIHVRNTPLPVSLVDFTSMYPTVNALMGLWHLLISNRIDVVDATDSVNTLLESVTADDMLNPETWPAIAGIAAIIPNGDVLPVRAAYDGTGSQNIGINRLKPSRVNADQLMWYTIPDLVAAKLLGGTVSRVVCAYRFAPADGKADTLRPVRFRGEVEINPETDDFFVKVVEAKQQAGHDAKHDRLHNPSDDDCPCEPCRIRGGLKSLANSGSYGIYSEFNRKSRSDEITHLVYGTTPDPWEYSTRTPEQAGGYCFPPIAALITGAAHLMLALLETLVTDAVGTYVFCDTDSMAIVADKGGELYPCDGGSHTMPDGRPAVRALTHDKVSEILSRFTSLNPYDVNLVPNIIVEEKRKWCYAISAKRYALYDKTYGEAGSATANEKDETAEFAIEISGKYSSHGLGHLLNPVDPNSDDKDWRKQWWGALISEAENRPHTGLAWLDQPAMSRLTVNNWEYYQTFENSWNHGKQYGDKVKPFNFLLTPHVYSDITCQHPAVTAKFRLIAPYTPDATEWLSLDYWNMHDPDGNPYRVTVGSVTATGGFAKKPELNDPVRVQTYRDVYRQYRTHPERKYDGPNGEPCATHTKGVLSRRTVVIGELRYIGKESEFADEQEFGLKSSTDAVIDYTPADDQQWHKLVIPVLKKHYTTTVLAKRYGVSDTHIRHVWRGGNPGGALRVQLESLAVDSARKDIELAGLPWPGSTARAVLVTWAEHCDRNRRCPECGTPVAGKARYCSARCQKRGARTRTTNARLLGTELNKLDSFDQAVAFLTQRGVQIVSTNEVKGMTVTPQRRQMSQIDAENVTSGGVFHDNLEKVPRRKSRR